MLVKSKVPQRILPRPSLSLGFSTVLKRNQKMLPEQRFLNRRQFLKIAGVAATAIASSPTMVAEVSATKKSRDQPLILGTPLTHCDWMLKDNRPEVVWGIEGVRHMLTVCKAAGMAQIYWRVLDAGRAMYKSRLVLPAENYEFDQFYNPVN